MEWVEQKLRLLKPILSPSQWQYLRMRHTLEKDPKKRRDIENMMDLLIARHVPGLKADNILLPPPERNLLEGEYPIGEVVYPDKPFGLFGVKKGEMIKHCAIFGKTGSGTVSYTHLTLPTN